MRYGVNFESAPLQVVSDIPQPTSSESKSQAKQNAALRISFRRNKLLQIVVHSKVNHIPGAIPRQSCIEATQNSLGAESMFSNNFTCNRGCTSRLKNSNLRDQIRGTQLTLSDFAVRSDCIRTFTTSKGVTTTASVKPEHSPAKDNETHRGTPSNAKALLYCSKVKNFVARLGVSARIGGRIPKNT